MNNTKIRPHSVVKLIAAFAIVSASLMAKAFVIGNLDFQILSEEERTVDVAWPSDAASDILIDSLFIPATVEIKGNIYRVTEIRQLGFTNCKNIGKFISIPGSVKKIGMTAFLGLENVDYIELNEGLEIIEDVAFLRSDIHSIHIPQTVRQIGKYACADCRNLTEVYWPSNLTKVSNGCFDSCQSLKPWDLSNIKFIGFEAFSECETFEDVVISGGCKIETWGFCYYAGENITFEPGPTILENMALAWGKIKKLELPEGIRLECGALSGCDDLTTLVINKNVSLARMAFCYYAPMFPEKPEKETNLNSLDSVIYLAEQPEPKTIDAFPTNVYLNAVLYVKPEALELARTTMPWGMFVHIEPLSSGVKEFISELDFDVPNSSIKEIFSLEGLPCGNDTHNLLPGTYIIRDKNGKTKKMHIKI